MRKIAVMSGKGGVGKSSICILLAEILSEHKKTLILDFDLCGPSCTKAFNKKGKIYKGQKGLSSLQIHENLHIISMGYMMSEQDSIIWRGPKKLATLDMFLESIDGFEYVVLDMPPGISEEHEFLIGKNIEVLVVTTSQNVALSDTLKCLTFCKENKFKVLGLIENMSGYVCDCCGHVNNIFSKKGGSIIANEADVDFLGCLEIDPKFSEIIENGSFLENYQKIKDYSYFKKIVENIINQENQNYT